MDTFFSNVETDSCWSHYYHLLQSSVQTIVSVGVDNVQTTLTTLPQLCSIVFAFILCRCLESVFWKLYHNPKWIIQALSMLVSRATLIILTIIVMDCFGPPRQTLQTLYTR